MVDNGAFSHKIDYGANFLEILNLEGHQNCINGFAEGVDFAYWLSFSSGGSAINVATLSILII